MDYHFHDELFLINIRKNNGKNNITIDILYKLKKNLVSFIIYY